MKRILQKRTSMTFTVYFIISQTYQTVELFLTNIVCSIYFSMLFDSNENVNKTLCYPKLLIFKVRLELLSRQSQLAVKIVGWVRLEL